MSLEDEHEVEQDERERVVAALVYGQEASSDTPVPGPWAPLLAGVAVALAAVLLVAMGTLVRSSLPTGRPSPSPHPGITIGGPPAAPRPAATVAKPSTAPRPGVSAPAPTHR